jgi:hypothetical protein
MRFGENDMAKYRSKPVVIDAVQYTGTNDSIGEVKAFMPQGGFAYNHGTAPPSLIIKTLEGDMKASPGDWIIKGTRGEFYPCKPDVFATKYEKVD